MNWMYPVSFPFGRIYWRAFWTDGREERTPVVYENNCWKADGMISIPWAVIDDYGNLTAVPSPNLR